MKSCLQCGKPISQEIENCPFCGIKTAAGQAIATLETGEGGRKKHIRWGMVMIVLLLGGAVTIAFLLNTSPKEIFLLSEYRAYKQMKAEFAEQHGEALYFSKKMMEQPSISHMTLQAGIETNSLPDHSEAAVLGELFNNAKIAVKAQQDPQNNRGNYNIALDLENEDVFDMDLIRADRQIGIKVPLLYSKFLYMNLHEYGDFMRKIDSSYTGPEKLEFSKVKWKNLELTEKEKKYLQKRSILFLIEQLKDENFTLEKGGEYQFKGEKVKLKKVTLSLTPEETKSLMIRFINQLTQDKKLHSIMAVRVEKVAKAGGVIEANEEVLNQQKIEADMVSSLKQIKKTLQETTFPEGFSSVLLIDKKQRIINRTMKLTVDSSGSDKVTWSVYTKNIPVGKDQRLKEWAVNVIPKENKKEAATVQWTNYIKGKAKERTEDVHLSLKGNGETVHFNMKSTFERTSGEKLRITRFFTMNAQGIENREMPSEISGSVKQMQNTNIDKKYANKNLDVTINVKNGEDDGTFSFLIEAKSKLVDKIKTVSFSNDLTSSMDINRMTEIEMEQLQQEIVLNIVSFMGRLGLLEGIPKGDPFTDDTHSEDLYKEDSISEEVFNSESSEHEKGVF